MNETIAEEWEAIKEAIHTSKTHPNYLTSNVFFMISGKENLPSLDRHWQQFDMFEEHAQSPDDALYHKKLEQKQLYNCFIGLSKNLDKYVKESFQKYQLLVFEKSFVKWDVRRIARKWL